MAGYSDKKEAVGNRLRRVEGQVRGEGIFRSLGLVPATRPSSRT
jgi:DNA-binding FrmR family transcriptional regulator